MSDPVFDIIKDAVDQGAVKKAEEAPKQEAPKQEAPKQEAPKQEAPKQEAPKQEAPKAVVADEDLEQEFPADILEAMESEKPAESKEDAKPTEEELALQKALESEEPPKEGKAWGALKSKLKTLEQQLEEAKNAPIEQSKLIEENENLKKMIQEKDDIVAKTDLRQSAKFKEDYVNPINRTLQQAINTLQKNGDMTADDAKTLVNKAFRMPYADRKRLLDEEAPQLEGALSYMLLQADEKMQVHDDALANWKATHAAQEESQQHVQKVQTVKQLDDGLNKAFDELAAAGNVLFKRSGENSPAGDAWNRDHALRKQMTRQTMLANKTDEVARLVALGYVASDMQKKNERLQAKYDKLKSEHSEVVAQRPSVNGRDPGAVKGKDNTEGMTSDQIMDAAFAGKL